MTSLRTTALALVAALAATGAIAQDATSPTKPIPLVTQADSLEPFKWVARPVVVFADTPNDPRFISQMELLEKDKNALFSRDVVVITDTDPDANSDIRAALRPRGFSLVLVGKDGRVNLRKPAPWDTRELTRAIDKMPLRKQEIQDAKGSGAG